MANVRASKKQVFQVQLIRQISKALKNQTQVNSSGLTSLSGHVFLKLEEILQMIRLAARSRPAKEKTWLRVARHPLTTGNNNFSSLCRYRKLRYLWNSDLAWREILSMTPMEELRPLFFNGSQ